MFPIHFPWDPPLSPRTSPVPEVEAGSTFWTPRSAPRCGCQLRLSAYVSYVREGFLLNLLIVIRGQQKGRNPYLRFDFPGFSEKYTNLREDFWYSKPICYQVASFFFFFFLQYFVIMKYYKGKVSRLHSKQRWCTLENVTTRCMGPAEHMWRVRMLVLATRSNMEQFAWLLSFYCAMTTDSLDNTLLLI